MRATGYAVESILTALEQAGLKIAARTLRAWSAPAGPSNRAAARTVTDALVEAAVRRLAFTTTKAGERVLAPEGLYGRRKMLALIRRTLLPEAGFGAVDRAMRSLNLSGVVRGRRPRTTIPNPADGRAPDLLDRDFTAPAPNRKWITDFTYVRMYQSFTYVAFIVDCFSQKIVSWHASVKRDVELVDVPLRMALWRRTHEGNPVGRDQLIHHSDAGSQYTSVRFTEHLSIEGIRPSIGGVGDAYDNARATPPRRRPPLRLRRRPVNGPCRNTPICGAAPRSGLPLASARCPSEPDACVIDQAARGGDS